MPEKKLDGALLVMYSKPADNPTLTNYRFRALTQSSEEAFPAFCNRVQKVKLKKKKTLNITMKTVQPICS